MRRCNVLPFFSIQSGKKVRRGHGDGVLTTDEGNRRQGIPPLVGDVDGLVLLGFPGACIALFLCVLDQLLKIAALVAVENVEKVRFVGTPPLAHLVREVPHEVPVGLHHGPEPLNRELIIERHLDPFDLVEMQEGFLFGQDLLEEVLVNHVLANGVNRAGTDLQSGGT